MRPTLSPWCGRPGCARPHRTPPCACARAPGLRPPAPNAAFTRAACAGARAAPARTERRLTRVRGRPGCARPPRAPTSRVCAGARAAPARPERRLHACRAGPPGCARPHRTPPYACARAPGLRPPAPNAALTRVRGRPGLRPPAPNAALRVCAGARAAPARPLRPRFHGSRCLRGRTAGCARPHTDCRLCRVFDRGTCGPRGAGVWGAAPPGGPLVATTTRASGRDERTAKGREPTRGPLGGLGGALVPPAFCRCSRRHGARPGVPPPAPRRYVFRERRELLVAARGSGVSAASRWRAEPAGLGCPST